MASSIYVLRCPTTKAVRYVGKTSQIRQRFHSHMNDACTKRRTDHKACWIRKLVREGARPEICLLFTVPRDMPWQTAEQFFIASGKAPGFALLNETTGGDGGAHDESSRRRLSEHRKLICKDPAVRARLSEAAKKSHASPEFRALQSASAKKRLAKPGVLERQSEAMRKWFANPENMAKHRAAVSCPEKKALRIEAGKKRWINLSDEARANIAPFLSKERLDSMRELAIATWSDPVKLARRLAHKKNPEYLAKISASTRRRYENHPEERAAQSERSKARWAAMSDEERAAYGQVMSSRLKGHKKKLNQSPEAKAARQARQIKAAATRARNFVPITHCKNGHPFDDLNTYTKPDGKRGCRACIRAASLAYQKRRNLSAQPAQQPGLF